MLLANYMGIKTNKFTGKRGGKSGIA